MKRIFLISGILACVLVFGAKEIYAQTVAIDTAINNAGDEFSHNLRTGSKVAILAVRSGSMRMSNFIIEELTSVLVNQRVVTVVDRAQLDLVQKEINFQMSGEVSDSSVQLIGRKLGAQYIVSGSFEPIGDYYRFRVRAIEVETAAITLSYSANVRSDQVVASLMSGREINPPVTKSKPEPETPPLPSLPQEEYRNIIMRDINNEYTDFSAGQRWGTWALNAFALPGLGSYVIMRDGRGGTTQLIMGLLSSTLMYVGYVGILDNSFSYDNSRSHSDRDRYQQQMDDSVNILIVGGILYVANGIYNIVRSSFYHKPQPKTASLINPEDLNFALFPAKDGGIDKVQLSYTLRF